MKSFTIKRAMGAITALTIGFGLFGMSAPAGAEARTCKAPKYPGEGYFTYLEVTKLSCSRGKELTLAHYRCRTKRSKTGKCTRVSGYSCSEKRRTIPTEINGRVTCRKGSAKFVYAYQQNT